jgi:hypothetical protein
VQPSYVMRPSLDDSALLAATSAKTKPFEPVGARAVWAKMRAAGIQFSDGGDIAVRVGEAQRGLSSVSRLPRTHSIAEAARAA